MLNEIGIEDIKPFKGPASLCSLGELTIENSLDRLSLYGSLNIAQDQQGLAQAQALKALLEQAVRHLQAQEGLPEKLDYPPEEEVDNPFL